MASMLGTHRKWEDWSGILIGALIALSPWLAGHLDNQFVIWNSVLIGAVVIALASLELTVLQRWEEAAEMLCGFWLLATPFAFGYQDSTLALIQFPLGGLLTMLGLAELCQDWHVSDAELAQRGQQAQSR